MNKQKLQKLMDESEDRLIEAILMATRKSKRSGYINSLIMEGMSSSLIRKFLSISRKLDK